MANTPANTRPVSRSGVSIGGTGAGSSPGKDGSAGRGGVTELARLPTSILRRSTDRGIDCSSGLDSSGMEKKVDGTSRVTDAPCP